MAEVSDSERLFSEERTTLRPISEGAEKWPGASIEDCQRNSMALSGLEVEFIKTLCEKYGKSAIPNRIWPLQEKIAAPWILEKFKNKRETDEFIEKLKRLGLVV